MWHQRTGGVFGVIHMTCRLLRRRRTSQGVGVAHAEPLM